MFAYSNSIVKYCLSSLVILLLLSLVSCTISISPRGSGVSKSESDDIFEFVVDLPETIIRLGEKVYFSARLVNLTDEKYTLHGGIELIEMYVRSADDETGYASSLIGSTYYLEGHEAKGCYFYFDPQEEGEYLLTAFSSFRVKSVEYLYMFEKIPITVVK